MLTLMLLRHAKSDRSDASLADQARPLTGRGRRAAQAMGRYLAAKGPLPDLVLCSPARRARDTWKLVSEELTPVIVVKVEDAIYDFGDGERLLEALVEDAGGARTVLIVGHNPSIERFALRLTGAGNSQLRARLATKFPTATLAVIVFKADDWRSAAEQCGELVVFVRPKDLIAEADD